MVPTADTIRLATTVPCTEAEGPGKRFAIWVQGCPMRCPECCNPEMIPFAGGIETKVDALLSEIRNARDEFEIEGITLIGGEPFAHATPLSALAAEVRKLDLTIMIFTGYTLDELTAMENEAVGTLLGSTDLLVDGRYVREQPDTERRWIGSRNQQVHFLSDHYQPNGEYWNQPDTLELRWDGTDLLMNGFPAKQAVGLWKRTPKS